MNELLINNKLEELGQLCINIVTNIDSDNFMAWHNLAYICYQYGKYDEANAALERSVNTTDKWPCTREFKYNISDNLRKLISQKLGSQPLPRRGNAGDLCTCYHTMGVHQGGTGACLASAGLGGIGGLPGSGPSSCMCGRFTPRGQSGGGQFGGDYQSGRAYEEGYWSQRAKNVMDDTSGVNSW